MFGILETRKVAERANIGKIHFRCLDEPLPDVCEVRAQDDHLIGGFEYGEPCLGGVDRNAEIPGDIGQIQELSTSSRQDSKEILVLGQVPNLPERANVPFETGLDVAGMPKGYIPVGLRREFRVPSSEEARPKITKDMRPF